MGTCKEDSQEQPEANQGPIVEENFITGPPASRTVIDNLKKLLVQRQHSRESDYENKVATKSTSGSNSDAAFFSQFSTSSSESDSDSDSCLIFEDISNQENRKGNGRRRHRRPRSYSSSSSSARSPAEKRRRKPAKGKKVLSGTDDNGLTPNSQTVQDCPQTASAEGDSANSTSSHKDSSSDDENETVQAAQSANVSSRLPKFRSRRDRNRKRRRSETNYANDRPNTCNSDGKLSQIPTIVISHIEDDKNTTATADSPKAQAVTGETETGGETATKDDQIPVENTTSK